MNKNTVHLILLGISIIIVLGFPFVLIPSLSYYFFGEWTQDWEGANIRQQYRALNGTCGDWGIIQQGNRVSCNEPICKKYNIDDYKCVYDGYTGNGFLGMKDYSTRYYICEGLGRVAFHCIEHYKSRAEAFEK